MFERAYRCIVRVVRDGAEVYARCFELRDVGDGREVVRPGALTRSLAEHPVEVVRFGTVVFPAAVATDGEGVLLRLRATSEQAEELAGRALEVVLSGNVVDGRDHQPQWHAGRTVREVRGLALDSIALRVAQVPTLAVAELEQVHRHRFEQIRAESR